MKSFKYLFFACLTLSLSVWSCGDDDAGPTPLGIVSIEASGTSFEDGAVITSDLNGASAAADVALDATITMTFDAAVDAATANDTNISISDSDGNDVDIDVSASGTIVTLKPTEVLMRGTMYTLSASNLKGTDGEALASTTRTFTTEGRAPVVVPNESDMIAYWNFDAAAEDATGNYTTGDVIAVEYGEDRFGQLNSTATFDGDESLIEINNGDALMDGDDITISFWVKTNSDGHLNQDGNPASYFVFGLAAFKGFQFEIPADWSNCKLAMTYELEDGTKVGEDLWFPGTPLNENSWQGWEFHADLTGTGGVPSLLQDKWAHVICTYDAAEKTAQLFINGELMKRQDFDLWPDGDPKRTVTGVSYDGVEPDFEPILALGFIKSADSQLWADTPWGDYYKPTANHFKGDLDDMRIFSTAFSSDDARALYDAEKP